MIMRIVVVLPAPLPPTNPVSRPAGAVNETSSTAVRSPNVRVSPRTSSESFVMTTNLRIGVAERIRRTAEIGPPPLDVVPVASSRAGTVTGRYVDGKSGLDRW
jgi:hypothetical protein